MAKKTVVTRQTLLDDDDDAATEVEEFKAANPEVVLFSKEEVDDKKIDKIHVWRVDPEEGYMGALGPQATEQEIVARWGGSEFDVVAKASNGRVVTRRRMRLAGDPIFMSNIAEARYRRMMGLKPKKIDDGDGQPTRDPDSLSMKDMILLLRQEESERRAREREEQRAADDRRQREQDERRREEREREDRERERDRLFQQQQLQAQRDHEAKMEAERRQDAERRERGHAQELERERAATAALIQQNNTFFQNMLAMAKTQADDKASTDPVAMLVSGMEMAMKMKEGEAPKDIMTTILERLPETLAEARETAKMAVQEVKGDEGRAPARGASKGGGDQLTLRGPLATKVKALAAHLVRQGQDPEKVIDQVANHIMAAKRTVTKNAPQAARRAEAHRRPTPRRGRPPAQVQAASKKAPAKKVAPSKKGKPEARA